MTKVEIIASEDVDSVAAACKSLQQKMNDWLRIRSEVAVQSVVMDTPKQVLVPVSTALDIKKQAKAFWFVVGMITYDEVSGA